MYVYTFNNTVETLATHIPLPTVETLVTHITLAH